MSSHYHNTDPQDSWGLRPQNDDPIQAKLAIPFQESARRKLHVNCYRLAKDLLR
jgi:hypothetical protein